jgi:hypothetical protein
VERPPVGCCSSRFVSRSSQDHHAAWAARGVPRRALLSAGAALEPRASACPAARAAIAARVARPNLSPVARARNDPPHPAPVLRPLRRPQPSGRPASQRSQSRAVPGLRSWHLRGSGRSALPEPPVRNAGCLPEPVKSAHGVPPGGLLTEPVRLPGAAGCPRRPGAMRSGKETTRRPARDLGGRNL